MTAIGGEHDSSVSALLGNGDGTFQWPVSIPGGPADLVSDGDFNGDGKTDLLLFKDATARYP